MSSSRPPMSRDEAVARLKALRFSDVRHPSFPTAAAQVPAFLLDHADETLLPHGIVEVPILSDEGADLLARATRSLLDGGDGVAWTGYAAAAAAAGSQPSPASSSAATVDGVGSMHSYGRDLDRHFPQLLKDIGAAVEELSDLVFFSGVERGGQVAGGEGAGAEEERAAAADPSPSPPPPPVVRLVTHSSHAIGYSADPAKRREKKLKLHVDDSKITVNVCLFSGAPVVVGGGGSDGTPAPAPAAAPASSDPDAASPLVGTDLYFTGVTPVMWAPLAAVQRRMPRASKQQGYEVRAVPRAGRAMIHLGSHPHRTTPVEKGERINWVLWYHEQEDATGGA